MEIVERIRDIENVQFDRAREDAWACVAANLICHVHFGLGLIRTLRY